MKGQQEPTDMLQRMADSMNLSVPEFEKLMREEHRLVPPDDEDDYYEPPKRKMSINVLPPDIARRSADLNRKKLLDPRLSRYDKEVIANELAQDVSVYGCVDERIQDILDSEPTVELKLELDSLKLVRQDKLVTAHQTDGLNSTVMALSQMRSGKFMGQPIDIEAYNQSMEKQMDELVASGTAREKRVAQFVIIAQQSAEKLLVNAAHAPTEEATAMVMEKAVKIMEKATKMLESLDDIATPKPGRLVEHVTDKQLPNKTKKLSEPNTGDAS